MTNKEIMDKIIEFCPSFNNYTLTETIRFEIKFNNYKDINIRYGSRKTKNHIIIGRCKDKFIYISGILI